MELSNDLIKIVIVLFPGFISMILLERLITNKKIEFNRYSLYIIVLSITSYSLSSISICNNKEKTFILIDILENFENFSLQNLFLATLSGVIISILLAYIINYKLVNKIGQKLKITNKYGDESVWDYFHNKDKNEWVTIRNKKNDLMYVGWIEVFSDDSNDYDELVLREVTVYKNSTAEKQYELDEIYISSKREDLTIEIFNYEE